MNRDSEVDYPLSDGDARMILERLTEAVLIVDAEGFIQYANPSAAELCGHAVHGLIGRPMNILLPDRVRSIHDSLRQKYMKAPSVRAMGKGGALTLRHRNGLEVPVEIALRPLSGSYVGCYLLTLIDVSERIAAEQHRLETEKRFRHMAENIYQYAVILLDVSGNVRSWNVGAQRIKGYAADEVIGIHMSAFYTEDDRQEGVPKQLIDHATKTGHAENEGWRVRKDGSLFYADVVISAIHDEAGALEGFTKITRDISERKALLDERQRAMAVFMHSLEGVVVTSASGRIVDANPAMTALSGYVRSELVQLSPVDFVAPRQRQRLARQVKLGLTREGKWQGEAWCIRQDGSVYAAMISVTAVKDIQGQLDSYVVMYADVTQHKVHEAELFQIANFDSLTLLPNRRHLSERVHQALVRAKRTKNMVAVCAMDLDGFKHVNDTFGHSGGDHLLQEVARRLQACVRGIDIVGRLGGDEFVVILSDLSSPSDCLPVIERMLEDISRPCDLAEGPASVSASIGVALYPAHGDEMDALLRNADLALYEAKRGGKNQYRMAAQL